MRADIAVLFNITPSQLTKAMTGIAYESGPHSAVKKQKATATTSTQQEQALAQSLEPPTKKYKIIPEGKEDTDDTLSSSSSSGEDLPPGL